MLVVCSDTHGTDGPRLSGRTLTAVRAADAVVHAGDFTTEASLDGFRREAARLHAVHGNADAAAVRARLPDARALAWRGLRIAVTHRPEGDATGLAMFGRARGADLVVFGHTHRPTVRAGDPVLLNPGSHADPRGNRPAHAEVVPAGEGFDPAGNGESDPGGDAGSVPDRRVGTTPDDANGGSEGSPADSPRRFVGRLVEPDGTVFERFSVEA